MVERKRHGQRLTVDQILAEMNKTKSKHLKVFNAAIMGKETPLGPGFHAGFAAATAIWQSYLSKVSDA